ncbi:MAG TPA: mechanosensitive ion channel family protein [Thermoanaerobaculia bacterium]|jgi:small-conductance mechanosensitive channel/CRP-like cAMP-binding protein|nr:mechanosensitive ion channel family protein [Thermoanaerobaculia bacterium]
MTEARSRIIYPLVSSAALFVLYRIALTQLDPAMWKDVLGEHFQGLLFAAFVPLILLVVRILDATIFDVVLSQRRHMSAPRLLRDVVAIGLYFAFFTWATWKLLGFSITKWLAAGTVIAAILGLALQETLGNLFSGIALHMEGSFVVGDVLRSGDHIGVIEGVTWRATRIRTFNNNVVILPNSLLARERLEVFPRDRVNGRVLSVGIDYNVPPATVINTLTQAASHVDGVSREIPCFARVASFGDSSVVYEIKYYTRDYSARDRIDADVRKAVWYSLRRNNISIPFPIRAFHPYEPPKHEEHDVAAEDVRERLQEVDILAPLAEAAHDALVNAARVRFYSRGETILRMATAGDSMFIVHEGTVSVRIPDDSKAGRHEVAQLGPGAIFGEMALLTGESRTADVVALTDVTAIEISKDALQPILRDHPELSNIISSKVAERRMRLHELQTASMEDEELTLLTRIRSYFGL